MSLKKEIHNLYCFFQDNNILNPYLKSETKNEFWAIAQHYGCATNLIDFTSDPKVAIFFATNSKNSKIGDECVIICLNLDDFNKFNSNLENGVSYFSKRNLRIPRIIDLDITNLWRIQAQKGCFMELGFKNYDVFLYHFDRIYFPFTEPFAGISTNDIYPERKSPIEIELDKFFMNELMCKNTELIKSDNLFNIISMDDPPIEEFNIVFKDYNNLTIHDSWLNTNIQWDIEKKINWKKTAERKIIDIDLNKILTEQDGLICINDKIENRENEIITFNIINEKYDLKLIENLNDKLNRLYDGMIVLPFTTKQIAIAIYNYLKIQSLFDKFNEKLEIEFGESLDGTGYYTRSYIFKKDLSKILRKDILSHLNDLWVIDGLFGDNIPSGDIKRDFENVTQKQIDELFYTTSMFFLQLPLDIRMIVDFENFVNLYAEKIIPFQIYLDRQTILFNPYLIRRFGRP